MKVNQWTIGLAAAGVISFGAVAQAEEKPSSQVLTAVSSTTLSGYVSTSAHWNPGSATGAAGYAYSAGKSDGFNLDVVDITISKPLDEGEWSAGYTAELWLGPDAAGIGNGVGAVAGATGVAIKQAFVALNAPIGNGLTLKLGIWDTIVGYEAANAGDNPNYTRSWGYGIEPTSHTGLLASYKVCDGFTVSAGIANTYNAALNARVGTGVQSQKTYLAGFNVTAPDSWGFIKGAVLSAGVVNGANSGAGGAGVPGFAGAGPNNTLFYLGGTIPLPLETVKLGASWDHLQFERTAGFTTGDADALAAYISFSGIEKLKINGRAEYYNGTTAAGVGGSDLLSSTVTFDYSLWANVISRVELRWDHDLEGNNTLPGAAAAASRNNSFLVALNMIYKF